MNDTLMRWFFRVVLMFALTPALLPLAAQDTLQKPPLRIMAGGGYLVGGQFFSESFTYNPAFSGEINLYYPVSNTVNIGVGASATILMREERFIPVYFSFLGFTKPNQNSNYILLNAGYSAAWSSQYNELDEYEFGGGMWFKTGFGRRFLIGNHSLLVGLALQHQWANATFTNAFGKEFKENLNYDWLAFELRFYY